MDTVIHYFTNMSLFLIVAVLAGLWLTSIFVSILDGRIFIALLAFFIPPFGVVFIIYACLLETKKLDHLRGKSAFEALMRSFKKEDKCILKKY